MPNETAHYKNDSGYEERESHVRESSAKLGTNKALVLLAIEKGKERKHVTASL